MHIWEILYEKVVFLISEIVYYLIHEQDYESYIKIKQKPLDLHLQL